jgi:hypothetical protein
MFMRKDDGTLRAWYFHVVQQRSVAPDGDWINPGTACEPFEIDPDNETIECVAGDRAENQKFIMQVKY